MRLSRAHASLTTLFLFCTLTLTAPFAAAQTTERRGKKRGPQPPAPPAIEFTIAMPQPHTHLLEVEMRLRYGAKAPTQVDLVMPVWTPGSYLVREYARHVQDFAPKDAAGDSLLWRKLNKNMWQIDIGAARDLVVTYRVYANELTVRTNELNDQHAFWNNAALLMHPAGNLPAPSTVRVVPSKQNWRVATGLPAVDGAANTFRAENFDILYDSPFLVGDFKTIAFTARDVPHRIVIEGDGNYDEEALRRDVQKVVETSAALMGDVPYRDYTFILLLHPTASGGLEHLNSTALIWRRFGFRPEASYRSFLSLVAHEFFHLWNVKRIRPDALGPFDYTRENYTRLLWVAEGVTSYYSDLLVRRAGLMSDRDYLDIVALSFQSLQDTPGRLEVSLEETSFDAWIKYYRPDENTINSTISYYDKGAIVALLLDLHIRECSRGARSLDDVLRLLYNEYAKRGRNYTPEDFQRAAEQVAGARLEDFFRLYVRGRAELNYNAALATAGLRLEIGSGADVEQPRPVAEKAYLGATLAEDGDRLMIRNVPAGTPAYDQGLNANDQIVAVDGARATLSFLNARLEEKRPGDVLRLSVFRLDELRTFEVKLGARREGAYRIVPLKEATAAQQKVYQDWLGASFPRPAGGRAEMN